jgi:hypothetical protein
MKPLLLLCIALVGCVTPTKNNLRDVVNRRHAQCQRAVATLWFREMNAFELYRCDKEEEVYCRDYGLEPRCGEWQL